MPETLIDARNNWAIRCGVWNDLATQSCLYQSSGYKHWLDSCPCNQCNLRRIETYSKIPVRPTGVTVSDQHQNTEYVIYGLRHYELPVKGTYVAPGIVPGYKYAVRQLGKSSSAVFPEPRRLLSIGLGYGRRLTFQVVGEGADHFWSDSNPDGYGLSLVAIEPGQSFTLHSAASDQIGRLTVTWVAPAVLSDQSAALGQTVKLGVAFKANVSLSQCDCGSHEYKDLPICGSASVTKVHGVATVTVIEDVALPGCETLRLLPADQAANEEVKK